MTVALDLDKKGEMKGENMEEKGEKETFLLPSEKNPPNETPSPLHFDDALRLHVGSFAKFQKIQLAMFFVGSIIAGIMSLEVVFVVFKPEYLCVSGLPNASSYTYEDAKSFFAPDLEASHSNWTDGEGGGLNGGSFNYKDHKCFYTKGGNSSHRLSLMGNESEMDREKCTDWAYDTSEYKSTIVTEFDLICDRSMMVATIKSLTVVGKLLAALVSGVACDSFGRRKVLLIIAVLLPAARIIEIAVPSIITFSISYCIARGTVTVLYSTLFIMVTEIVDPGHRAMVGTLGAAIYPMGFLIVCGVAYLIRERWILQLVVSLSFLPMILFWFLPESPRWLFARGKQEEGLKEIRRIARVNGRSLPDKISITVAQGGEGKASFRQFCASIVSRVMLMRVFVMSLTWFTCALVYYALTLNIEEFAGNIYMNTLIIAVGEVVGIFISQFMMTTRLGRRLSIFILFISAGLPLLLTLAVPSRLSYIRTALAMFGRLAISGAYNIAYIYAAELYPTVQRSIGISIANTCSKIGGTLAPFIWKLADVHPAVPLSIYGAFSLSAALLCLLLPETKGKTLPQHVEELQPDTATTALTLKNKDNTTSI